MQKILLAIFFIVVIFFFEIDTAWGVVIMDEKYHPNLAARDGADCAACHTTKIITKHCSNCHNPPPPDLNLSSYLPPSPPEVKYDSATNLTIHSNYSSNTDACASCHSTHTAVGTTHLLKWTDIPSTCISCHDGTIASTYNVKLGIIGNTTAKTSGGKFGVSMIVPDQSEPGLSYHNFYEFNTTSAAPGGTRDNTITDNYGVWNTSFNCSSCHEPHGLGGNSRILNPDPNGIATQNRVVGETLTEVTPNVKYSASKQNWLLGYSYDSLTNIYAGVTGSDLVATGYTIYSQTGEVVFSPPLTGSNIVKADYVPGISVKMQVTNKLEANESVTYTSGMSKFCGACHTDYDTSSQGAASGHTITGVYRNAYRHGVGMVWNDSTYGTTVIADAYLKFEAVNGTTGTIMCLTCHFAHGTDDAFINNGVTTDTEPDRITRFISGSVRSTALKRQVNMTLCETCHQK